jgi:hypothetical protein
LKNALADAAAGAHQVLHGAWLWTAHRICGSAQPCQRTAGLGLQSLIRTTETAVPEYRQPDQ